MQRTVLVAIGGNSLIRAGEPISIATQRMHVRETCRALAAIISAGWRVVVTHGNGPQVGAALRRSELGAGDTYPLPLDMCVASTQGEIGVLLQQALGEALEAFGARQPIATVVTQTVVSPDDPAFGYPSKPVGPFYSLGEAERRRQAGWTMIEEAPYGYRRAVASPAPMEIVEEPAIRALMKARVVVIAAGGGGVPVARRDGRFEGVDAVVDKDLASALLATRLRVDILALCTDVDRIYLNFARADARGLGPITTDELRRLATDGHFPAGTMGPKVDASLQFIAAGGSEVIVTSPDRLVAAIEGRDQGTHVMSGARAARRRRVRALESTVLG
jgi:carbamate kinase